MSKAPPKPAFWTLAEYALLLSHTTKAFGPSGSVRTVKTESDDDDDLIIVDLKKQPSPPYATRGQSKSKVRVAAETPEAPPKPKKTKPSSSSSVPDSTIQKPRSHKKKITSDAEGSEPTLLESMKKILELTKGGDEETRELGDRLAAKVAEGWAKKGR
ncbi:hypothetical protein RQP46_007305 [Phenoliferia psychrophenolica]